MHTVVIIEDNHSNAQMLRLFLERRGYQVSIASNTADGLDIVYQTRPSIVLMDLRFPGAGRDGWETIHTLKADPTVRHIPIIAVSVEVLPEDRERAFAAGCIDYFAKPVDLQGLLKAMEDALR